MNNRKHWTPEETEYLVKNYSDSQSAPAIALRLGFSPTRNLGKVGQPFLGDLEERLEREGQPCVGYLSVLSSDRSWTAAPLSLSPYPTSAPTINRCDEGCPTLPKFIGSPAGVGRKARAEQELSLLEAWAETKPLPDFAEAWNRKAAKNGWPKRSPNASGKIIRKLSYTTKPIVGCYIKAHKQGEGEHSSWIIRDKDLARFALAFPFKVAARITPEAADWLLHVIADSRGNSNV